MFLLINRIKNTNPTLLAFFASLLLSLIAFQFEVTVGKDAALYLDVAKSFNEEGLRGLFNRFNWPWFSLLLAISHNLTGLALETLGYLYTALFMAICCALWVDMLVRRVPGSAGWALLVVLAMPAFNQFRGDILREQGFWCFSTLALWLALHWEERGGWKLALLMQLSVLLAALFRLEAIVLMPALVLWRLFNIRAQGGWLRFIQITLPSALLALGGLFVLLSVDNQLLNRVTNYLYLIKPQNILAQFNLVSERIADLLAKYSADDSGKILFFGFLAALIWTFIRLLGPFVLPLLSPANTNKSIRLYWQRFQPIALAFILYFAILMIYFIYHLFINGRYTSFLNMLAIPLVMLALMTAAERFPRAIKALVVVCIGVMLANVVSLSAKKTHYLEAANWLKEQELSADNREAFYFEDGRIAYYADWGYPGSDWPPAKSVLNSKHIERFRYLVFEEKNDSPWLIAWFKKKPDYKILAQFANTKGKTVLIIGDCGENPVAGCEALDTP